MKYDIKYDPEQEPIAEPDPWKGRIADALEESNRA